MWAKLALDISGVLLKFGLKWLGTRLVHKLLDRICMWWAELKDEVLKEKVQIVMKELDMQARFLAVKRREKFKWKQSE